MKYQCTVGFADGSSSTFSANLSNVDEFRARLLERGIFLVDAKPDFFSISTDSIRIFFSGFGRIKRLIQFTRLLTTLIRSGINIDEALRLLAEDEQDQYMRIKIEKVRHEVQTGSNFSTALSRESDLFDSIYTRSVMAGERSGDLPSVLERLLDFYKKRQILKKKVMMALMYPAILAFIALLAIIGLITWIVPKFTDAFANMQLELPIYTRFVIGLSDFMVHYGILLLLFLGVCSFFYFSWAKTASGREKVDRFKLGLPLFGTIIGYSLLSNFMRTLSTMLKGGIPLLEALIITGKAVGNVVYEERLTDVVRLVEEGESFHAALKKSNLFPSLLVKMVKIGEESGNLEEMLEEASNYFDEEVDTMATTLASLLEPILMMILAAVFLGIMLSIILPVFTAGSQMPF